MKNTAAGEASMGTGDTGLGPPSTGPTEASEQRGTSPMDRLESDPTEAIEVEPPRRVGIGLPVYNGERYLEEAIRSLLVQTYTNFELVIVDNASTDRTEEIGRAYQAQDSRVRYHRNPVNLGAAPNFNRAFRLSRGDYFKWTADDDLYLPGYLGACVAALDRDPTVVLAHAEADIIDREGRRVAHHAYEVPETSSLDPNRRFQALVLEGHKCLDVFGLVRREVLEQTPLIASYIGSDRELLAELGLHGRFYHVPERLFLSRDHPGRSTRSMDFHERTDWFDPTLSGKINLPYWRGLLEYGRAIGRVNLTSPQRLFCLTTLLRYVRWYRPHFEGELKRAVRGFVRG